MAAPDSFDFIVVGAGSAGAAVAARLTEDPQVTVLLLEAGPDSNALEVSMPAAFAGLFKTKWDWNYSTTPQPGLDGQRALWPRMKALGGCSAMNAMIYIRGHRADYDRWKRDFGAVGWGYDDVLPYFVRAEGNADLHDEFHGTQGPLHVESRRYTHELTHAWVASAVASGLPANDDFNGARQEGAGSYQVTCRKGRRWSTAEGYLRPAMARPNLTIATGALTTRVLLDGTRAIGVAYLQDGVEQYAYVNGEVVLSGGAINSPQLLMLSGIGPGAHLAEHGIDVVADLPGVGGNLHDHPVTTMVWSTKGTTDLAVDHVSPGRLVQWQATGRGPLSSNVGEGGGFVHSRDGLEAPDVQFIVAPTGFYDNGLHEAAQRMFTTGVVLVDVASRGRLTLASADPRWRPVMDPAYFQEQVDLDATLAGVRQSIEIARQGPLAKFIDRPFLHGGEDDASLLAHIRQWTQTLYHPVGTCAMGSGDQSVVDPELRVNGIEGLRVADASVMPRIMRGNTNAPAVMVGEKAADLLRGRSAASVPTAAQEALR